MSSSAKNEITLLLQDEQLEPDDLHARLTELVYEDLKKIASNRLAAESPDQTLSATSLVHEAYLKLSNVADISWESRRHYFGAAAQVMRRILIDRARYHSRQRRGGEKSAIPLDDGLYLDSVKADDLLALDDALTDLEAENLELAHLVKLRYFAGLSMQEISELEDISLRTANRRWQTARTWLLAQLSSA